MSRNPYFGAIFLFFGYFFPIFWGGQNQLLGLGQAILWVYREVPRNFPCGQKKEGGGAGGGGVCGEFGERARPLYCEIKAPFR